MAHHLTNFAVRFTLAILALLTLGASMPAFGAAPARTAEIAVVAKPIDDLDPAGIYGASPEFTVAIQEAIERFESTGLSLPELRIYYHSDASECLEKSALFNLDGTGTRIDLCTEVGYTLLHELAHAWEYHSMDDATRQAYLDETGLLTWSGQETDWSERGVEKAATAIAWGLLDIPITNAETFAEELRAFELLTGTSSPRLGT